LTTSKSPTELRSSVEVPLAHVTGIVTITMLVPNVSSPHLPDERA